MILGMSLSAFTNLHVVVSLLGIVSGFVVLVHLARMALFAVNTGLRDANLCRLQWSWEVPIAELNRSVFVIPAQAFNRGVRTW